MGISRDNWHKRRKTGGKRKPFHGPSHGFCVLSRLLPRGLFGIFPKFDFVFEKSTFKNRIFFLENNWLFRRQLFLYESHSGSTAYRSCLSYNKCPESPVKPVRGRFTGAERIMARPD